MCNSAGYVGYDWCGSNNSVAVIGQGSVWSNSSFLAIGITGPSNSLVIQDGGAVFDTGGNIGCSDSASSNAVTVTGSGSLWQNSEGLYVGNGGCGNSLTISNGGVVVGPTTIVGFDPASSNTLIAIDGGSLIATNSAQTGVLWVNHGTVILYRGLVQVDSLIVTNADAQFINLGGTLIITHSNPPPSLCLVGIAVSNRDVVLTWQTTGGKTNVVQASASPGGGYINVSTNLVLPGTGAMSANWIEPGAITNWARRFYRIQQP